MKYISSNIIKINDKEIECLKIDYSINGSPRYVIHFLDILSDDVISNSNLSIQDKFRIALNKSRLISGKKYMAKWFGGGIVISSYNLRSDLEQII